jgi:hypothetical protein
MDAVKVRHGTHTSGKISRKRSSRRIVRKSVRLNGISR